MLPDPDPHKALADGRIQAILTIPDHLETDLISLASSTAPATAAATIPAATQPADEIEADESAMTAPAGPTITVSIDRSRTNASYVEGKVSRLLDQYQRWAITQRLSDRHIPTSVLAPLSRSFTDIATGEQRLGRLLAIILPFLLLVTGSLGALFPALSATTTERELGTLETLLVTPALRAPGTPSRPKGCSSALSLACSRPPST